MLVLHPIFVGICDLETTFQAIKKTKTQVSDAICSLDYIHHQNDGLSISGSYLSPFGNVVSQSVLMFFNYIYIK